MNLLADESIDAPIVEQLRADGHVIGYVAETSPSITDDAVLDRANKLQSLLMTSDKDFGKLLFSLPYGTFIITERVGFSAGG